MSILQKGDLVMTNFDKLLWYDHTTSCDVHYGRAFDNKLISFKECHKATRAEVEAYLKEKGWLPMEDFSYCLTHPITGDLTLSIFEEQGTWAFKLDGCYFVDSADVLFEQLREAITMARLLNATKD